MQFFVVIIEKYLPIPHFSFNSLTRPLGQPKFTFSFCRWTFEINE